MKNNLHIVLFEPEIPPNTGNIARLCAATQTDLHLIKPLGFSIEDKYLKRAGLDYWEYVHISVWSDFAAYLAAAGQSRRLVMTSAKAGLGLHKFEFSNSDSLIFGPETRGLPADIFQQSQFRVRIPICNNVRSLNLSTAAGIVLYAALNSSNILEDW